jgi:hypothetical protein
MPAQTTAPSREGRASESLLVIMILISIVVAALIVQIKAIAVRVADALTTAGLPKHQEAALALALVLALVLVLDPRQDQEPETTLLWKSCWGCFAKKRRDHLKEMKKKTRVKMNGSMYSIQ